MNIWPIQRREGCSGCTGCKGVLDYATVKVLHATDPERRSWAQLKLDYGSHSFRIGGKNDMERINIPEPIQLESMRSTDLTVARGYNRQEALMDPRVEAVLHYTAEDNVPVLHLAGSGGASSPNASLGIEQTERYHSYPSSQPHGTNDE